MHIKASFKIPRIDLSRYKSRVAREAGREAGPVGGEVPGGHCGDDSRVEQCGTGHFLAAGQLRGLHPHLPANAACARNRVQLGLEHGEAEFETNQDTGVYSFTYHTTLSHLYINEYYDATAWGFNLKTPGPYHFQERGRAAFQAEAITVILPDWRDSVSVETIQVQRWQRKKFANR